MQYCKRCSINANVFHKKSQNTLFDEDIFIWILTSTNKANKYKCIGSQVMQHCCFILLPYGKGEKLNFQTKYGNWVIFLYKSCNREKIRYLSASLYFQMFWLRTITLTFWLITVTSANHFGSESL